MKDGHQTLYPLCGVPASHSGINPWLRLVIGFGLVAGGALLWGWLGSQLPGARQRAQIIDERGLRATAIYYTDLNESAEGAEYIRHRLENPPRRASLK